MDFFTPSLEESNSQLLTLINKYTIQCNQFFPVFGFSQICPDIERAEELKAQQVNKIKEVLNSLPHSCKVKHEDTGSVHDDDSVTRSYKDLSIIWNVCEGNIPMDDFEGYLKVYPDKKSSPTATSYRKLLCVYDYKKYSD